MAVVLLVIHEDRPEAVAQADSLAATLAADGHTVVRSDAPGFDRGAVDGKLDLVVSLGGDGSILRAVHLLDGRPVPVLGVNHGELGDLWKNQRECGCWEVIDVQPGSLVHHG